MKRPSGATFLAILLGSFATGQLSRIGDQVFWPLTVPGNALRLLAMGAAAAAGVAAVGLWRLRPWAFEAVIACGALMLGVTAFSSSVIGHDGFIDVTTLLVFQGILFALIARYVHWVVRSPSAVAGGVE